MAKRYELSDEAWTVVADLFTATHVRGSPRSSDRLMQDGVLWDLCSGAAWRDMPSASGLGRRSIIAFESGETAEHLIRCSEDGTSKLNDKCLIDLHIWMIYSTAARTPMLHLERGKKGGRACSSRSRPQLRRPDKQNPHSLRAANR
jgi:transposase